MSQWSEGVHARIAAAIREVRGKRSAQWVADRTAELGHPITRAQITNYENGRKESLDVADLIVISVALGTSPVCLVYPGPYGELMESLPGVEATQFIAAEWFSGLMWASEATAGSGSDEWNDSTAELNSYRRIAELEQARNRAILRHLKERSVSDIAAELAAEVAVYETRIRELKLSLGIADGA